MSFGKKQGLVDGCYMNRACENRSVHFPLENERVATHSTMIYGQQNIFLAVTIMNHCLSCWETKETEGMVLCPRVPSAGEPRLKHMGQLKLNTKHTQNTQIWKPSECKRENML